MTVNKEFDAILYQGESFEDYQLLKGVSCSQLKSLNRSALQYWYEHESGQKVVSPTLQAAFDFGSAFHALVLENKKTWLSKPIVDRRTKVGKEEWAKFQEELKGKPKGFVTLTLEEEGRMKTMRDRLMDHPITSQLLTDVKLVESVIQWRMKGMYPEYRRMRMDGLATIGDNQWIIDLKTCQSVQPEKFQRHALSLLYHWQAAYYLEGFNALQYDTGRKPAQGFLFIAVEKEAPHDVGVFRFDDETLGIAQLQIERAGQRLRNYKLQEGWPGAVGETVTMECPQWLKSTEY